MARAPQLVGPARAAAGEVEIEADDDALAGRMIAATEDEIWREATGLADDDNTGDNSLERMADGFDDEAADDVEREDDGEPRREGAPPRDRPQEGDDEAADSEDDDDVEYEDEPLAAREPQRQERQPARQQPDPNAERIARLEGELTALRTQAQARPAPAATEKPAKPDMFSDPDGYERWVLDQAEQRAMASFETRQAAQREERLNASFSEASRGERGQEFMAAYQALAGGPQRGQAGFEQHARVVQSIINAPDPVNAVLHWWEQSGGADEYQASILAQAEAILGRQIAPRRGDRDVQPSRGAQNGARPRLPPSLNGRSGSGTHREIDPEMMNGSESSIFEYGTRRN
jgi:hypothetical protein